MMPSAWSGSIRKLKTAIKTGRFLDEICAGFNLNFYKPTETEILSWQNSVPILLKCIDDPKYDSLEVILELSMPIGAERADIVLLGGNITEPTAIVLELKQWSSIKFIDQTNEVEVPGIGINQHPSLQALNYAGKLRFFNAQAHKYDIDAAVFMHNAGLNDKSAISKGDAKDWVIRAPIYTLAETNELAKHITTKLLPSELPANESERFSNAPYIQSNQLFTFLQEHAIDIANNTALAIANVGMGLTSEQDRIKNEILLAVSQNRPTDFIVQGSPGSGKTLLAVSLLLEAAENKRSTILALRNNRLQAILRGIFDRVYPGVSGMMMFFEPRQGRGIAHFDGHVDILICDEAQRMENRIIPTVIQKATVNAIFLDETQRLNPPEQGTVENFAKASQTAGHNPKIYYLSTTVRIPVKYNQWVEKLLNKPSNIFELNLENQTWSRQYAFEICESIGELLSKLASQRSSNDRVALVASFTESPGDINNVFSPNNLRIGYPLTSGFDLYKNTEFQIPWLMSTSHYKQFWIGGRSNQLDRIASIYGSQGFESDIVGVIWGRDLLYRDGEWVLGDPNNSYDNIDRLITGRSGSHRWNQEALELMINRYRIFLTRGFKGTMIYCEDWQTRNFLLSLKNNSS